MGSSRPWLLNNDVPFERDTHIGWPRTWKELLARGMRMGKERVQKLMQLHGIRAKGKPRFKVTTDSNHDLPISPN